MKNFPVERFWSTVNRASDNECWKWLGTKNHNSQYSVFYYGYSVIPAHRASYSLLVGGLTKDQQLRNTCGDSFCVNPAHWTIPGNEEDVARRFWAKVNKSGPLPVKYPELERCWLWTAARNPKGYGIFTWKQKCIVLAHRASYTLEKGAIPPGYQLDHLCHNPSCVRPVHLEVVTNSENKRREIERRTHCKWGHLLTPENTYIGVKGERQCARCRWLWNNRFWNDEAAQELASRKLLGD